MGWVGMAGDSGGLKVGAGESSAFCFGSFCWFGWIGGGGLD